MKAHFESHWKVRALAVLASLGLLLAPGIASAGTATSTAGFTFSVVATCSVTGNVLNLGSYISGTTAQNIATAQGSYNSSTSTATAGSASAGLLATVNCPTSATWNLAIVGTGTNGAVQIMNPGNTLAFLAWPQATNIGGTALTSPTLLNEVQSTGQGLSAAGTGSNQLVNGYYLVDSTGLTTTLVPGTYNGTATATLNF